ncbi:MAG: AAA family ATPase [Bacillales bacterium]|nr:AAA family ATPase [Bacillales bacterium]
MNHISIEGMDGVGKSTTCKLLSERLGYKFVEKPLHYLFDESEDKFDEYLRIRDQVNANPNRVFTSWFYGLGSIYMYELFKDQNIVTDRHFASNYAWSGAENNGEVYDLLIKKLGVPKLTVILYSPSETIMNRLMTRNKEDNDIKKAKKSEMIYSRMIEFCKTRELPYLVIDTSNLKPEEVVDRIVEELNKNA